MYEYRKATPEQRKLLVEERLRRGFPSHEPPHLEGDLGLYLVTAACYEHRPIMREAERRLQLLEKLDEVLDAEGAHLCAWVVLPNHYHLLLRLEDLQALGRLFHLVHGSLSHAWNAEDRARGRRVWYRFSDRAIRGERHYHAALNYVHYNPVKHGWASSPYAWEQSSVHSYLELYGRDWLRDLWVTHPIRDLGRGWDDLDAGDEPGS